MLSLARLARLQFPFLFGGAFIEALRAAHPCLRGKHFNLPYNFVGTFPKTSLLRSWTHYSPGTELFATQRSQNASSETHPPAATRLLHESPQKNSTRRNSVINSLISQNTPSQC